MTEQRIRFASRILLFDGTGRMLLFLDEFLDMPGRGKWLTPGGGVDPGETAHQAAVRELYEETGLVVESLGEIVHSAEFPVMRPGAWHTHSHWDFYVHRVAQAFEPSRDHWTADEHQTVKDIGWWTPDEIDLLPNGVAPWDLADLARRFQD